MKKDLALCAIAVLVALVSFVSDAFAQIRCGDFIQNGTIYVASRARDCNRGTAWQRDSHGRRYWGPANQGRAYYKPRYQQRPVYPVAAALPAVHHPAPAVQYAAPPAPVQASPASCPQVNDARRVHNTMCRPNDQQYSWRGQSNFCLGQKPASPNAYMCYNTNTRRLAWYTP